MQRAMATEAEASREARAKVIAAQGEKNASQALKEAADVNYIFNKYLRGFKFEKMSSSLDSVGLKRILENSNDDIIKICTTLIKILSNIVDKPNETEHRRIRLESSDVMENLMPYSGGLEVLFEIGFQEVL